MRGLRRIAAATCGQAASTLPLEEEAWNREFEARSRLPAVRQGRPLIGHPDEQGIYRKIQGRSRAPRPRARPEDRASKWPRPLTRAARPLTTRPSSKIDG